MNWGTQLDRAEALVVVLQLELLLLLLYSILFFLFYTLKSKDIAAGAQTASPLLRAEL